MSSYQALKQADARKLERLKALEALFTKAVRGHKRKAALLDAYLRLPKL